LTKNPVKSHQKDKRQLKKSFFPITAKKGLEPSKAWLHNESI